MVLFLFSGFLRRIGGKPARRLLFFGERQRKHKRILKKARVGDAETKRRRQSWWGESWQWYPGGTPPRQHNHVTPLIDGAAFFTELEAALVQAKEYVYIAGWVLTPHFPLVRDDSDRLAQSRLLSLLSTVAQNVPVRILVWSGSPVLFTPSTHTAKEMQKMIAQQATGNVRCYLDRSARITHCHHQKAVVIDGRVAFVGGMDLTTFQGDRYDKAQHDLRPGLNWHDVQLKIEGAAVADVEHNFRQRWQASVPAADKPLPHQEPRWNEDWHTPVQIVRTIPHHTYKFAPRGEFGILHAYAQLIAGAQRFIYFENQYLWSPIILDALIEAMNKPRTTPLRIVIVLPAQAEDGKWDNDDHVKKLRAADAGRGIITFYSLYTSGVNRGIYPFTYRSIYVHAKVAIVDDEWLMAGSANLNNRGLITDSEIDALVHEPSLAQTLRVNLWSEHLGLPVEQVAQADPIALIDQEWPQKAAANKKIYESRDALLSSAVYPFETGHAPGAWFLEELEALTFEH